MIEYLIRTAATQERPAFLSDLVEVFMPGGFSCELTDGPSDFAMRRDGTEITISGEDPGWQVSFDGPMPAAACDLLVEAITRQVERAANQACDWIRIT